MVFHKIFKHFPFWLSECHFLQRINPVITNLLHLDFHLLSIGIMWYLIDLEEEMWHMSPAEIP